MTYFNFRDKNLLIHYFSNAASVITSEIQASATPYATGIVIRKSDVEGTGQDQILTMVDSRGPVLCFPGGCVDQGEPYEAALDRHVKERLNTAVTVLGELGDFYFRFSEQGEYFCEKWYFGELDSSQPEPKLGEVGAGLLWVPQETMPVNVFPFQSFIIGADVVLGARPEGELSLFIPQAVQDQSRSQFAGDLASAIQANFILPEQVVGLDEFLDYRKQNPNKTFFAPWADFNPA